MVSSAVLLLRLLFAFSFSVVAGEAGGRLPLVVPFRRATDRNIGEGVTPRARNFNEALRDAPRCQPLRTCGASDLREARPRGGAISVGSRLLYTVALCVAFSFLFNYTVHSSAAHNMRSQEGRRDVSWRNLRNVLALFRPNIY